MEYKLFRRPPNKEDYLKAIEVSDDSFKFY